MVDDKARALQDLRGLVGRLETAPSISVGDARQLSSLARALGYESKARVIDAAYAETRYGLVVAYGAAVVRDEETRLSREGKPRPSMWQT